MFLRQTPRQDDIDDLCLNLLFFSLCGPTFGGKKALCCIVRCLALNTRRAADEQWIDVLMNLCGNLKVRTTRESQACPFT